MTPFTILEARADREHDNRHGVNFSSLRSYQCGALTGLFLCHGQVDLNALNVRSLSSCFSWVEFFNAKVKNVYREHIKDMVTLVIGHL